MNVSLRTLQPGDAMWLRCWSEDEETASTQGARAVALTEDEAHIETRRLIAGHGSQHYSYMVEVDGATVGNCWLGHLSGDSASLGIVIGEARYRGRGVGTEVVRQLLAVASHHDIRRVYLWTLASNGRAIRLYRRLGFVDTGRRVRDVPRSGMVEIVDMEWRDPPVHGLTGVSD